MKIFSFFYDKAMSWAKHKNAPFYLCFISFIESIFWPIPVDVMLAPMALANRKSAIKYSLLATIFSVLGGIIGYYIGHSLYTPIVLPFIEFMNYQDEMQTAFSWFSKWGIMIIFVASFTPIPFKVFTVSAGIMNMLFFPFIFTAMIGRGLRFFLVSGLMILGGEKMEAKLRIYIDRLGWATILLCFLLYFIISNY